VFVSRKPLEPSLVFVGEARSLSYCGVPESTWQAFPA